MLGSARKQSLPAYWQGPNTADLVKQSDIEVSIQFDARAVHQPRAAPVAGNNEQDGMLPSGRFLKDAKKRFANVARFGLFWHNGCFVSSYRVAAG